MIDTNTYKIGLKECNQNGFLTIKNMISLMLDVSFDQARRVEKNIDMDNFAWMLYSWDLEIKRPIKDQEKIQISTIPTHMKRFYAYRQFHVKKDGEVIANALAKFILFDKEKLRPAIIGKDLEEAYGRENQNLFEKKVKKEEDFDQSKDIYIRKADKDINGHVNNALYFDYIKEMGEFRDENISFIKMVYKNEIRDEKKIHLSYKKSDKVCSFSIDSPGKNHAYGEILYV